MQYRSVSPRLAVADVQNTVAYYREVLGFDDWSFWPEDEPTFAIVTKDGVSVQFQQAPDSATNTAETTTLHFTVSSAQDMLTRIGGRAAIEWGPEVYSYGRREFAIRDCNGVMVIFSEITDDLRT